VGGNDIKSITINILTRTLTNSVATEYSWIGGKKKLVFSNLYLWKIILSKKNFYIIYISQKKQKYLLLFLCFINFINFLC